VPHIKGKAEANGHKEDDKGHADAKFDEPDGCVNAI